MQLGDEPPEASVNGPGRRAIVYLTFLHLNTEGSLTSLDNVCLAILLNLMRAQLLECWCETGGQEVTQCVIT